MICSVLHSLTYVRSLLYLVILQAAVEIILARLSGIHLESGPRSIISESAVQSVRASSTHVISSNAGSYINRMPATYGQAAYSEISRNGYNTGNNSNNNSNISNNSNKSNNNSNTNSNNSYSNSNNSNNSNNNSNTYGPGYGHSSNIAINNCDYGDSSRNKGGTGGRGTGQGLGPGSGTGSGSGSLITEEEIQRLTQTRY